ncbi:MAG: tetratricopeptide repeat protein [Desulfurobacteriaceae bacterium]
MKSRKKFLGFALLISLFSSAYAKDIYYSFQLGTFPKKNMAENYLRTLPIQLREKSFLYRTDKGFWTVRIFVAPTINDLKGKENFLKEFRVKDYSIVPTSIKKLRREKLNLREKILRLSLKILLENSKLYDAFKVAKKGTELFPNSPFWWRELAKISLWVQKPQEALRAYTKFYGIQKDKRVLKEIYRLAVALRDFKTAQNALETLAKENPKEFLKNFSVDEVFGLFQQTGDIDKGIELLSQLNIDSPKILRKFAKFYWFYGMPQKALEIFSKLRAEGKLTLEDALLLSNILISKRKYKEALSVLKDFSSKAGNSNYLFWRTLADISWELGDFKTSVEAIKRITRIGKAKKEDWERLIIFLSQNSPEKALDLSLKGYEKFKSLNFLFYFFDLAFRLERWEDVIKLIEELPTEEKKKLLSQTWIEYTYVTSLLKTGQILKALNFLKSSLERKLNKDFLAEYLYLLMKLHKVEELEKALKKYQKAESLIPESFILSYIYLQEGKKALLLSNKVKNLDPLLKADVLELIGRKKEAKKLRFLVYKSLKEEVKGGNNNDVNILTNYLRTSLYFENGSKFLQVLPRYKKRLPQDVYRELYLSFLAKNNQIEKLLFLRNRKGEKFPLWLEFSLAEKRKDFYSLKKLEEKYRKVLPIEGRIAFLSQAGETEKAFHLAFRALEENRENVSIYQNLQNLFMKEANFSSTGISFESRENSNYLKVSENLLFALRKDFKIGLSYEKVFPSSYSYNHIFGLVFLEKELSIGKLKVSGGILKTKDKVESIETSLEGRNLSLLVRKNFSATETDHLFWEGKKDEFLVSITYPALNRLRLSSIYGKKKFSLFSGEVVGYGEKLSAEVNYYLRFQYPDIALGEFLEANRFREQDNQRLLPDSYFQVGAKVSIGVSSKDKPHKKLKPFFEGVVFYNQAYGFGGITTVGFGKSIFGKDNLLFQLNLSTGLSELRKDNLAIGINYKKWFK